jgi:pyrroline-5-carboxylate reductase
MDLSDISGTIAFVGAGVMGETILSGLVKADFPPARIRVSDARAERVAELVARHGVTAASSNEACVSGAEVVVIAVKPYLVIDVLDDLREELLPEAVIISVAAGISTQKMQSELNSGHRVVRIMPNTPAQVGAGMATISPGADVDADAVEIAQAIANAVGQSVVIPEALQDAATALHGSGPAYLFLVAQAMIDAGVQLGLTRTIATDLTVNTLIGSGRLLAETGVHPTVAKEQVTSPGGTTAVALAELEAHGVRTAFTQAIIACAEKSKELGS